jgi:hypothetical protein
MMFPSYKYRDFYAVEHRFFWGNKQSDLMMCVEGLTRCPVANTGPVGAGEGCDGGVSE